MLLHPKNVRGRLTLWYVCVLAVLLVLAWGATSVTLFWQFRNRLDRLGPEEIETVEHLLFFTPDGRLRLPDDFENYRESKDMIASFVEVRSSMGPVLFRNERLGDRALGGMPVLGEGVEGYSPRSIRLSDGNHVRLMSRAYVLDGHQLVIRLAHSEEPMHSLLRDLVVASTLTLPLMLVAAGFAGYSLAGRMLSPIEEMVNRVRQITVERLSERLPNADVDNELGRLARVFNEALARLEHAFDQLRRFTSDCSHELRTPLALIRSLGEVGLHKNGTCDEYRDVIGSMLEEVYRLTTLVDDLLAMARADSGCLRLERTAVPLMEVAREAANLFDVLIEEKSLRLVLEGDEHAEVEGDSLFLRQTLANLIHNAVKFSPVGETVSIRVRNGATDCVSVEVQDHGPGISSEDRDKVFDRFYRADKSGQREFGGAGLGLSIAKWVVEAHGGSIGLGSVAGQGCTFRISLPRLRRETRPSAASGN
jgi:heavy metal sensor kinase